MLSLVYVYISYNRVKGSLKWLEILNYIYIYTYKLGGIGKSIEDVNDL